jgi:hypothetical protein
MKRKLLWGFLTIIALAVLWALAFPVIPDDTISGFITKEANETKQVGLAVKMYADDHQGRLPRSLDELVPAYLPDKSFFPHVYLATPHALLGELPLESIILFRVATDGRRHETRIIVVHPDISLEWKRP